MLDQAQRLSELDDIVAALHPRHRSSRRSADIEDEAPPLLRAIWQALGVSEATLALDASLATWAVSRERLEEIFQDWHKSPRSRAVWRSEANTAGYWAALPPCVRLVGARLANREVAITDESTGASDPPVLVMREEVPPLARWHDSYLEWFVWHLLHGLCQFRRSRYDERASLPTQQRLAGLYPALHEIGDGLWWIKPPAFCRDDVRYFQRPRLIYRSFAEYCRFVRELPDDTIGFFEPPVGSVAIIDRPRSLDLWKRPPPDFRTFAAAPPPPGSSGGIPHMRSIGRVDEWPIWLSHGERAGVIVTCDPRAEGQVKAWIERQGLKASWTSLPPDYDRAGW